MRPEFCFETRLNEHLKSTEMVRHQTGLELINTRLWIQELTQKYERQIKIDIVPDEEWQKLFEKYDSFWFMGIYTPSQESKDHAKIYTDQYRYAIPQIDSEKDVTGSPYAIPEYAPNFLIADGWDAWDKMVEKLHTNNKKVFVDFVPNHTAVDHPWAKQHPEYFIQGTDGQYNNNRSFYKKVEAENGKTYYLAHGKDPNYSEWADTLQLNYANPKVQKEMEDILLNLVNHADGVRCDMAMLLNPSTFLRTWGWCLSDQEKDYIQGNEFWKNVVPKVKERAKDLGKSDFEFVAEAYWDKEELGKYFDYIYNDEFYKHIKKIIKNDQSPSDLRNHLNYIINVNHQGRHYKDVLYTENHDEERSFHEFGKEPSKAAAVLAGLIPDALFLVNQGQEDGKQIRPPMQISRFPEEVPDMEMQRFYKDLLTFKHSKLFQENNWKVYDTSTRHASMIALEVSNQVDNVGAIVCVNFGNNYADCSLPKIDNKNDVEIYSLSRGENIVPDKIRNNGIYIGLSPWETQIVFYSKSKIEQTLRQNLN